MLYYKSRSLVDLPGELVEGQVPTVTLKNLLRVLVAKLSIWDFFLALKNIFLYECFVCNMYVHHCI